MTKVTLSDRVTLFHGDALGVLAALPAESVDAVLTDPPYSSGGITLSARQAESTQKYQQSGTRQRFPPMLGDAKDQRSWTLWCILWLSECWRLAREGAPLLVFTDWRQLPALTDAVQCAGWSWRSIVIWDKLAVRPQLGRFRHQCEYVVFASKGRFTPPSQGNLPGVYAYHSSKGERLHLTSKPVALIKDLLAVTAANATVLDPFMGGGSVGEACLATGRGYIGIELSADYFRISRARLQKCLEEPGPRPALQ